MEKYGASFRKIELGLVAVFFFLDELTWIYTLVIEYFQNYFTTYSQNMNTLWSGIKTTISHKHYSTSVISKITLHCRLLSLLETISEALLRETFFWGCVRFIFQANALLFYRLSKSGGPRFLSRSTTQSRFLSLASCDQKQISNVPDLKTQSLAIKSLVLRYRTQQIC